MPRKTSPRADVVQGSDERLGTTPEAEASQLPAIVANVGKVREFSPDDLDPAYGSHGTHPSGRPKGGALPEKEKEAIWSVFLTSMQNGLSYRKALKNAGVSWGTMCRWIAG